MLHLQLSEIKEAIRAELIAGDLNIEIKHIATRLKNLKNGCLYFHLNKKEIDLGSLDFLNQYVIVTDMKNIEQIKNKGTLLQVRDIKEAYWSFIHYYRNKFEIPVIGVTGTCGKTTTKEMIKHILKRKYKVHSTFLSQNGLAFNLRYLLGIDERTEAAIFEMGVAYPGNIRLSGKYFKPTIGVITNIGEAHLEGCKTLNNYIKAKGEMLEALAFQGTLLLNADDENTKKLPLERYKGKALKFGIVNSADYKAANIKYEKGGMQYILHHGSKLYDVFIPGYGEHNVYNSLAAIAISNTVGLSLEEAISSLKTFKGMDRHVKIYHSSKKATIIDDTWSCNLSSVHSAVKVLKNISKGKKEVLVLGKMQRLGDKVKKQHIELGKNLMDIGGVNQLIAVDPMSALTCQKAIEQGMDPSCVHFVQNADELLVLLDKMCDEETIVLFKMSLGKMKKEFRDVVRKYCSEKG